MGGILVTLQFGLLLLLALLAAGPATNTAVPLVAWLLAGASLVLVMWTLLHNRLGNFNIRPTPKDGGVLVLTGPYRRIRHPMYTSVMLGAAAMACTANAVPAWLAWLALAVVLLVKSRLEERWMCLTHPAYVAYMQDSKRFLPWLF